MEIMEVFLQVSKEILNWAAHLLIWTQGHLGIALPIFLIFVALRLWLFLMRLLSGGLFFGSSRRRYSTAELDRAVKQVKARSGPPPGMNKEVWVSRELGKIENIIAEAELEAEHQWRIENDEHDDCAKCKAKEEQAKNSRPRRRY